VTTARKRTGDAGEKAAARFLISRGYSILDTNFRCRYGEIDIIARHKECLVFVEVRTKKSLAFGTPQESITRSKMDKLILTAQTYMQQHEDMSLNWRIDVIAIVLEGDGTVRSIELLEGAVA
jgi:putative endonuclease